MACCALILYWRPMTASETYRAHAAAERAAAEKTNLPNRRAMHERSASTWEGMAQAVEETAERALVNQAAKAAR
jgi:hypothetical protein